MEFYPENGGFCIENDGSLIEMMDFKLKIMNFKLKMMVFWEAGELIDGFRLRMCTKLLVCTTFDRQVG